jgi:hypothetical protein
LVVIWSAANDLAAWACWSAALAVGSADRLAAVMIGLAAGLVVGVHWSAGLALDESPAVPDAVFWLAAWVSAQLPEHFLAQCSA